jgi:hypothetical protein
MFNTILISYVRRSKQNTQQNSEGVELRRHNGGNQSEQRKTTIMLSKSNNQSSCFFSFTQNFLFSCCCNCIYCLSNSSSNIFNTTIIFS